MTAETLQTKAELGFAEQFKVDLPGLPGAGNAWAKGLRDEAWKTYESTGLPHRRVEEWKYTDLRGFLKDAYPTAPPLAEALGPDDVGQALGEGLAGLDATRLVIVDGHFRPELSDADALEGKADVLALADALAEPPAWLKEALGKVNPQKNDTLVALNTALMTGGVALRIADGAALEKPVHLVHVFAARNAASIATRNVVVVGGGARVTLLESYVAQSSAPAQRNTVTELSAGDGAEVHHVKFQNEGVDSAHLTTWMTRLGADVKYRSYQFATGAGVARNQVYVHFAGEGSSSHVSGAVLARGSQHNDTTIVVDHAVPSCESREYSKLVLDGEARGVIQCKVNVHRDAQKSDGHQLANALLLSEQAEFDSKPELEIFADDVVCGHGSTSGQVDEELLFYLRSRGIPEAQARALLILAFVGESLERVEDENIREVFHKAAEAWLDEGGA